MDSSAYRFNKRTERVFVKGMDFWDFVARFIASLPREKRERWTRFDKVMGRIWAENQLLDKFKELESA